MLFPFIGTVLANHFCRALPPAHQERKSMTHNDENRDQQRIQDEQDRQKALEQSRKDQARQDPDPQHRKEQDRNPQDRRG